MPRPSLAGKKGVILFEVSGWSDAQGHATLFNGQSCYDHCYFNEPEAKILHGPCELLGLAMKSIPLCLALVTSTLLSFTVHAADQALISPQAGARTYAQNYKDMVLATCMTQAYRNDTSAATDAGSSASALRDWTYFDMEKSPDAVKSLVNRYLARDYSHPLVESEIKGVRFDFLKCMDLYHSKALEDLVKRLVTHPKRTYRQEDPSRARAPGAAAR